MKNEKEEKKRNRTKHTHALNKLLTNWTWLKRMTRKKKSQSVQLPHDESIRTRNDIQQIFHHNKFHELSIHPLELEHCTSDIDASALDMPHFDGELTDLARASHHTYHTEPSQSRHDSRIRERETRGSH